MPRNGFKFWISRSRSFAAAATTEVNSFRFTNNACYYYCYNYLEPIYSSLESFSRLLRRESSFNILLRESSAAKAASLTGERPLSVMYSISFYCVTRRQIQEKMSGYFCKLSTDRRNSENRNWKGKKFSLKVARNNSINLVSYILDRSTY